MKEDTEIWECLQTLSVLSRKEKVTILWFTVHCGIQGNEVANIFARKESGKP
jgi:ribonuclease HI